MSAGITEAQRQSLRQLGTHLPEGAYLAGGVAVALSMQHRRSADLDLFVPSEFDPERLEEQLASTLHSLRTTGRARGTLHLELHQIPISILSYRYPMLQAPALRPELGVHVAGLEDLVCMKLSAIAGRGAAKDFWDLDAMLRHGAANHSLAEALRLYTEKYTSSDPGHVVRSLAYFDEADAAPLPLGLSAAEWRDLKARFAERVRALE